MEITNLSSFGSWRDKMMHLDSETIHLVTEDRETIVL